MLRGVTFEVRASGTNPAAIQPEYPERVTLVREIVRAAPERYGHAGGIDSASGVPHRARKGCSLAFSDRFLIRVQHRFVTPL